MSAPLPPTTPACFACARIVALAARLPGSGAAQVASGGKSVRCARVGRVSARVEICCFPPCVPLHPCCPAPAPRVRACGAVGRMTVGATGGREGMAADHSATTAPTNHHRAATALHTAAIACPCTKPSLAPSSALLSLCLPPSYPPPLSFLTLFPSPSYPLASLSLPPLSPSFSLAPS
ncbi:unnamed protein product [Closterium sp. Naga37s-1]|nr:unnamed protein product [Closterium sp. Naga37s-1]